MYFQLTKSRALALLIAFLVLYSVNIYGSATWGGSLPFFATQFFLPLVLLFVGKYISVGNMRWFLAAILASGLGFLAHPLPMFAFTVPCASMLIFFGMKVEGGKLISNILVRLRQVFIFSLGSLFVALLVSYERLSHTIMAIIRTGPAALFSFVMPPATDVSQGATQGQTSQGALDIAKFYQDLVRLLYTDTNVWLFWLVLIGFILFLLALIFGRKKSLLFRVLPYALMVFFAASHTFLNAHGFNFFPQGWYREFWAFPILLGALVAALWGQFYDLIRERIRFDKLVFHLTLSNIPFMILAAIFGLIGYLFFTTKSDSIIQTINTRSEISSAHPQALSIRTSEEELSKLKKQLIPSFIDPNDKNKRLYEADALVNIWWSSFYELPLVKGYVDPPLATSQRGGIFWLDIAIANDSIVRDFKVPIETALNNALFLIDWYGVYYYEGGRFGIAPSVPPSSYLLKNNVFENEATTEAHGALFKWLTPSGKPELNLETPQYLKFYKVRDEYTSPVIAPVNSPAVLVFADDEGYENFTRAIGASNFNSKYLIPVKAGQYIDDFKASQFISFDAIFLHNYKYHNKNKAFEMLSKFVQNGGKIFIDTGAESKESNADKLPEIFPIENSRREGLGRSWEAEVSSDPITKGVDVNKFGPLVFNDSEWKLSYPSNLRNGTSVIIRQKGKPILVRSSFGRGQVIWSGINLLYHLNQYKSENEERLFANIVKQMIEVREVASVSANAKWISSQKVTLASDSGARGVLFKEEYYPGWSVKLLSNGGRLPIYKAGPTYPGFMYVPLPKREPFKLEFTYGGQISAYFYWGFSLILILLLLDKILFGGFFLNNRINFFKRTTNKKISTWWEKEDE